MVFNIQFSKFRLFKLLSFSRLTFPSQNFESLEACSFMNATKDIKRYKN